MFNKAYKAYLKQCVQAGVTSITLAPPGTGKTQTIRQIAAELDRPLVTIEGAYVADETPLQGLPVRDGEVMRWIPPAHFVIPDNAILFIDEITSCTAPHLLYALILERRIDTRRLGDGVNIIAAGNREEDGGSQWSFSPVIGNRASVMEEYKGPSIEEWVEWAIMSNLNPLVTTGIRFGAQWLNQYDANQRRNPTPRSWEMASKLLDVGMEADVALRTTVGEKACVAMELTIANAKRMPLPSDILDTVSAPPTDVMIAYITILNLQRYMQGCSVAQAINAIKWVKQAIQHHGRTLASPAVYTLNQVKNIHKIPVYREFVAENQQYL